MTKNGRKSSGASNPIFQGFFFLVLTVIGSSILGEAAWEILDELGIVDEELSTIGIYTAILAAGIVVFGLGVGGLYRMRQRLLPTRARISENPPQEVFGLVAGLSSKSPEYGRAHVLAKHENLQQVASALTLSEIAVNEWDRKRRIDDPLTPEDKRDAYRNLDRFPWQQTLRVIHRLRDCRHIALLTTERSDKEVEEFVKFFADVWDGPEDRRPEIHTPVHAIEFENYDDVAEAANTAVNFIKKKWPEAEGAIPEDAICIDITAGIKIFSIAAAVVTLNQSLNFSYANNNGHVRFFDAKITPLSTLSD